ncbi:MAG: lysylphosphatidylglycerol synthase transmembrane domain-containing protein [Balneolaceae bacterium]
MTKRALNIIVSLVVAGLFIWLAIRNVNLPEVWAQIQSVTFYWLPFFVIVMLFSHFLRAERWRLLLVNEGKEVNRSTLFAGVMLGYVVNNIVPRLGEISRPVYVAKKGNMNSSSLLGTIVTERLFDLATMILLIAIAAFFLISDVNFVEQVLGFETDEWRSYLFIPATGILLFICAWLLFRFFVYLEKNEKINHPFILKLAEFVSSFGKGMTSIRYVKNWPLFLLLTAGIWAGYVVMTYLPFFMMNLQAEFGLTLKAAVVLTMVSSIGVSIPTPAGIGSYHLLIQQSMWLLYNIPLVSALTYATVTHAVTVLLVFLTGPLALWWDKYYTLKNSINR